MIGQWRSKTGLPWASLFLILFITFFASPCNAALRVGSSNTLLRGELDAYPAWSPDGRFIAFTSDRVEEGDIWILDLATRNLSRITSGPWRDGPPHWSPDSKRIVFDSARTGNRSIWAIDRDGKSLVQLTDNSSEDRNPAWSPDGGKIVFQSNRGWIGDEKFINLWMIDSDGTNLTRLTNRRCNDQSPAWNPDAKLVVFAARCEGEEPGADLWLMDLGRNESRKLTQTKELAEAFPRWSPDGKRILISDLYPLPHPPSLYVMDADGTNLTLLTSRVNGADWSPDGTRIVLSYDPPERGYELLIALLEEGGDPTGPVSSSSSPGWSPLETKALAYLVLIPAIALAYSGVRIAWKKSKKRRG